LGEAADGPRTTLSECSGDVVAWALGHDWANDDFTEASRGHDQELAQREEVEALAAKSEPVQVKTFSIG
jgi:hypothetical protein